MIINRQGHAPGSMLKWSMKKAMVSKKSPLTKRKILTRKGAKHREIDICAQVKAVGRHKSRAVLGFCHVTGTDWGGKFVGLSKKTWMTVFLSHDDNDPIVEKISLPGEGPTSMSTDR